jgi:SAM-dependent methyltransferase
MGTALVQGQLWGAKARNWAEVQEPQWQRVYEAVLSAAGVRTGTKILDIGCGAGGALRVARRFGAEVTGLDAAQALVEIARERLPGACIEIGEMENLPFEGRTYDLVTSFNAFQFAGNLTHALRDAGRVCRHEGTILMLVWGRREDCDLLSSVMPAVLSVLPPSEPSGPALPLPLADPGVIEDQMRRAGLAPRTSGEIEASFSYSNAEIAWRALSSAAPFVRVIAHAGEPAVKAVLLRSLQPYGRPDGSAVLRNRFRWVMASPA